MLNHQQIVHVKGVAADIFLRDQLCRLTSEESHRRVAVNKPLVDFVINTISDAGILFLATWDDLASLWRKVREQDDDGVATWLLQASVTFQILAFPTHNDVDEWAEHLSRAYGSYTTTFGNLDDRTLEKNLALDDDLADRLPKRSEFRDLLRSNPWFMFLATLQLSSHEITEELVNENKHRLGRPNQGEAKS